SDTGEASWYGEKLSAVHHNGDVVLAEQGQKIGDRRVGGDRLEPRHHHVFDRPRKGRVGIVARGDERGQHVALVDQADDMPARVDDRNVRDVGRAHAGEYGAQIVLGPHHHRSSLAIATDDDVAHSAVPVGVTPAFLGEEDGIEYLRQIFRAG